MIVLLSAKNDEGWLGYVREGYTVTVHARTREEARVELLKKLQKLGFPPPAPRAFQVPSAMDTKGHRAPGCSGSCRDRLEDPDVRG
jgi:hypothetical protein